jgi:hypothetical protein
MPIYLINSVAEWLIQLRCLRLASSKAISQLQAVYVVWVIPFNLYMNVWSLLYYFLPLLLPPNNCFPIRPQNIALLSSYFVAHLLYNAHPHFSNDLKVTQFPILNQNPKSKVRSDQGLKQERHLHQYRGRCQKILWGEKCSSGDSTFDYAVEKLKFEQKIPKKIASQSYEIWKIHQDIMALV